MLKIRVAVIVIVVLIIATFAMIAATSAPARTSAASQASIVPEATAPATDGPSPLTPSVDVSTPPAPPPVPPPAKPLVAPPRVVLPAVRAAAPQPPPPPPPPPQPPSTVILPVPFTPQAPTGDWTRDQESCEEATLVMYHHYLGGDPSATIPAQQAENEITAIRQAEDAMWGSEPDLAMEKIGELAQSYYGYHFQVLPASIDAITAQIRAGHPVVVPAMTGTLRQQNSHFNPTHSLYHVLLLKGFKPGYAVANDEGVTAGMGWTYTWPLILQAMDDANAQVPEGRVMLVLS